MRQSRPLTRSKEASLPNHRTWRGLYVALATPLADEGMPHHGLLAARAQALLAQGCDGVALFGTTGEGPAFPVAERIAGLEALLAAGIPPERLVVGASATAAGDALALTRHALAMGISEVLLTPPFFLKAVDDDGLFRFYAEHIARAGSNRLRLLLYHIPPVTGIALGPELIERLASAFPEVVIGVKDSGADWPFTRQLLERFPELEILCGEETHLPQALAQGGAGTICGMANFVPQLMRRLIDRRDSEGAALLERLCALSAAIDRSGAFHRALRALVADVTGEPAWLRCLPPLSPLPEDRRAALVAAFHELIAGSEAPGAVVGPQFLVSGLNVGH
jgi:4-hydroxy-tetrahydrodipicolinate synthase